jgi:hypothetical protein
MNTVLRTLRLLAWASLLIPGRGLAEPTLDPRCTPLVTQRLGPFVELPQSPAKSASLSLSPILVPQPRWRPMEAC